MTHLAVDGGMGRGLEEEVDRLEVPVGRRVVQRRVPVLPAHMGTEQKRTVTGGAVGSVTYCPLTGAWTVDSRCQAGWG